MDPILAALSPSLLALVEGSLSNDEVSSDEEMLAYFIDNGLTEEQARQALTYRDQSPMATPNCSTVGQSNCSRQDGVIMQGRA